METVEVQSGEKPAYCVQSAFDRMYRFWPTPRPSGNSQRKDNPVGEKRDTTGKRVRPKTAARCKRYLCAKCRKRSPIAVTTPAPWYCPKCLRQTEST